MRLKNDGTVGLSATDLASHPGCHHLTQLSLKDVRGELKRPAYNDPILDLLREKGDEHERRYLQHLESRGLSVVRLTQHVSKLEDTRAAMEEGADVVYQARLSHGRWQGWADFLLKTEGKSGLGDYHYEVVDTKLARETQGRRGPPVVPVLGAGRRATVPQAIEGV